MNNSCKYKQIYIGIDQSYKNTGISIVADGNIVKVTSLNLEKCKSNSEKRKKLRSHLNSILMQIVPKSESTVCILERIRLQSQGFLNIDYIKSIGALNSVIVDACHDFDIQVFSVDTRCWKANVVGTSKPQNNKFGVPPEKWPTVKWVIDKGFEKQILITVQSRKSKGTFERKGIKYMYNNDASDSAGIAMFGVLGDKSKLKEEH
jgi:Holliday junction resolvasome RuvABC endonuclease subunit